MGTRLSRFGELPDPTTPPVSSEGTAETREAYTEVEDRHFVSRYFNEELGDELGREADKKADEEV